MDKLDLILQKLDTIEIKVDSLEKRIDSLEKRMEEKFLKLDFRMDNEIISGLRVVADGHFNLNCKLNSVMDDHTTKEQMYIRMIHISSELQKIQNHCKHCA